MDLAYENNNFKNPTISSDLISKSLCKNCKNSNECTYLLNRYSTIQNCNEFDPIKPKILKLTDKSPIKPLNSALKETPKGLCKNCIKFSNCTFPKSEGGIWFCDEYEE